MGLSEKTTARAQRIFPVLVYYASIARRSLTYGELAKLTNDHHRPLRFAFELVHDWIEETAAKLSLERLPLAIIVVNQDSAVPGPGAIRWRLEANGLASDSPAPVITAMFEREQKIIFEFPHWHRILEDRGLEPYKPPKTDILSLTHEIKSTGLKGESAEHRQLKIFVSQNPEKIGLSKKAELLGIEWFLPSADRIDVLFRDGTELVVVEVKPSFIDEAEFTRGIYQCIKYAAILSAVQLDQGSSLRVSTRLVCRRSATPSEAVRSSTLQIPVVRLEDL